MKTCSKCGKEKSLDDFNKDSRKKDGHKSYCRDCQVEYRQKNKGDQSAYWAQWYESRITTDPLYFRVLQGRKRAAEAGTHVDKFTSEDLRTYWASNGIAADQCHYCGTGLQWDSRDGLGGDIDHVTPLAQGGGHTVQNLMPSCSPCNRQRPRKSVAV